jgi:hypothetical protein
VAPSTAETTRKRPSERGAGCVQETRDERSVTDVLGSSETMSSQSDRAARLQSCRSAGRGGQHDISERIEDILANEMTP